MTSIIGQGVVGYVATFFIIMLLVTIENMLFFNVVSGRLGYKRYITFGLTSLLSIIFCLVLAFGVQYLLYQSVVSKVIVTLDMIIWQFMLLIRIQWLLAWFMIPIALAFVFYGVLSLKSYIEEYRAWYKWNLEQEAKENGGEIPKDKNKGKKKSFNFNINLKVFKKHPTPELEYTLSVDEDILSEIPYKMPIKLLKISKLSKNGELQIGKTDNGGYVMIVNNPEHEAKLREMTAHIHDEEETPKMPYIVFFDEENFKAQTLKEYGKEVVTRERESKAKKKAGELA
ncbi:hypothetical protein [Ligilactobacillus equi]|uniref:Uncharacterized protein n=1 Tax=Ligilactobacillus equi DSM 15833 = JCM 10991 TaxID=1423740 RepID=A0A0R1TD78_9LACO|nr:hypothetical protein [Ligilactobacillus equi]KRL79212.1 hypothetical protein FC36_GL000865 [Ligilactobacillus equi DSM 15833 = JCM 10991]